MAGIPASVLKCIYPEDLYASEWEWGRFERGEETRPKRDKQRIACDMQNDTFSNNKRKVAKTVTERGYKI